MATSRYTYDSPYHHLKVTDSDGVRTLAFERNHQSSMHLDDPFETDIEYVGYLHLTLAVCPQATTALVIGLGGGSLVKRMWRDYPWMSLDAVELDGEVIEVARELFALPDDPRITVIEGDGRLHVETCGSTYDIIVIDAFDDDRMPRPLITEEFMRACRDRLRPGGVIAYNLIGALHGARSRHFRSVHRTASNVWGGVWTFTVRGADESPDETANLILLASDADLTDEALTARIAGRVNGLVTVPAFERFAEDLYRGNVRTGDVPILSDPARCR